VDELGACRPFKDHAWTWVMRARNHSERTQQALHTCAARGPGAEVKAYRPYIQGRSTRRVRQYAASLIRLGIR
jgi:hypothetical protein